MMVARVEDQEARKKWVRGQAVQHIYGEDDDDEPQEQEESNHNQCQNLPLWFDNAQIMPS